MKINVSNTAAINAALTAAQGKAEVNTINAKRLADIAGMAEKRLDGLNLPEKYRAGACFFFCDAGPTANSYRFKQGATWVSLKRGGSAWFLTGAKRTEVHPKEPAHKELALAAGQADIALRIFREGFSVLSANPA